MNVLWITNIVFPEAQSRLNGDNLLKNSGGWMLGASEEIVRQSNIKLFVASVSKDVKELTRIEGKKIVYFLLPYGKGNLRMNHDYEPLWRIIYESVHPHVIHIHGTEFSHGLAYVNACGSNNVVVSIQGMLSACSSYYYYGLSITDILKNLTFRDVIKGSIFQGKKDFKQRGLLEIELLKKINHIIGRTNWDKARTWEINPCAEYHFCNEILRREFYDGSQWNYDQCEKHTIFLSQAGYPLKGLHQLIKAIPLVLQEYPDTIVRIAGNNITKLRYYKGLIPFINGYGQIIKRMIKSRKLENRIVFVGSLDATEMKKEFLRCNVFVCPSSIENSPNSLGEAQILGTPCVCSYVGGVPDMMKGDEGHLYRFEEYTMLAKIICDVFDSEKTSPQNMISLARHRHDRVINSRRLIEIYNKIVSM